MTRPFAKKIALAAALAVSVTAAQAQGNGSCNGARTTSTFFEDQTSIAYSGGDHLATETTTFTVTGNFQFLSISVTGDQTGQLCGSAAACDGFTFTAPADGNYRFEANGRGGPAIEPGLTPTSPGISGRVTANCVPATTEPNDDGPGEPGEAGPGGSAGATAASNAAAATGNASANTIGNAIAAGASGTGGPISGTRNALRFSTAGMGNPGDRMWNVWGAVTGRRFDGGVDGDGYELTVGADYSFGAGSKAGLVLSYGDFDLTSAGLPITAEALSVGPYVSFAFARNWKLDGFLVFAQPDYTIAGTSFSADRMAGGLNLNTTYMLGNVELTSFVALQGFNEDHPAVTIGGAPVAARSISSLTGSVGSKATFNPGTSARPYLSLAAEANRFDDGLGTETDNFSPRLGAGIEVDGKMGDFRFHVEGGEVFDGTRDYSIGLGYNMRF